MVFGRSTKNGHIKYFCASVGKKRKLYHLVELVKLYQTDMVELDHQHIFVCTYIQISQGTPCFSVVPQRMTL